MRITAITLIGIGLTLGAACGKKDEAADKPAVKTPEAEKPATPEPEAKKPAPPPAPMTAVARLEAKSDSKVAGTVTFTETDGKVEIKADVTGLTPGEHGFHIHEKGDCSAPDGTSAGGHFNPKGSDHGLPAADTRHLGDLGNLKAGDDGAASMTEASDRVTLGEGDNSIAGLAVIVHEKPDDGGQPTGNAGGRVACGVITVQK